MSDDLSPQQFKAVMAMSGRERYQYFVQQVVANGHVWSLANHEGWVALSADGHDCVPVWPSAEFAASWATGDWSDCEPRAVTLDVWLQRWVPGMEQDGSLVAVFPNLREEGVVVSPAEVQASLLAEMGARTH